MRQHRNMFQKEQGKTPEELSEVELGNQPKKSDHKDDQRTQKKNGCTEREVRSF